MRRASVKQIGREIDVERMTTARAKSINKAVTYL
jgi:hypothetical protein